MKKKRFTMLAVMLLTIVICMLMTGCGSGKARTESQMKRVAADLLEEKYGEEFEIHYAWPRDSSLFYATCSPKSNPEIVFDAQAYNDGRGLYKDEYIQGLVTKQMNERMKEKVKGFYGEDCFIVSQFYGAIPSTDELIEASAKEVLSLDELKELSVEEYYNLVNNIKDKIYFGVRIYINKEELNYDTEVVRKEFECLENLYSDEPMEDSVICYFVDELTLNECRDFFKKQTSVNNGTYLNIINDEIEFGFGIHDGVMNETFETYDTIRKGMSTDE